MPKKKTRSTGRQPTPILDADHLRAAYVELFGVDPEGWKCWTPPCWGVPVDCMGLNVPPEGAVLYRVINPHTLCLWEEAIIHPDANVVLSKYASDTREYPGTDASTWDSFGLECPWIPLEVMREVWFWNSYKTPADWLSQQSRERSTPPFGSVLTLPTFVLRPDKPERLKPHGVQTGRYVPVVGASGYLVVAGTPYPVDLRFQTQGEVDRFHYDGG